MHASKIPLTMENLVETTSPDILPSFSSPEKDSEAIDDPLLKGKSLRVTETACPTWS